MTCHRPIVLLGIAAALSTWCGGCGGGGGGSELDIQDATTDDAGRDAAASDDAAGGDAAEDGAAGEPAPDQADSSDVPGADDGDGAEADAADAGDAPEAHWIERPLPRIEVAVDTSGNGYFRDRSSGGEFVPRGNSYVRLTTITLSDGGKVSEHSLFAPSKYDAAAVAHDLAMMASYGYNVVRVFIDPGNAWSQGINGPPDTPGLSPAYLDNFEHFYRQATSRGIYVVPSLDLTPFNRHYREIRGSIPCDTTKITGRNGYYLCDNKVQAKKAYLGDFIDALAARVGPDALTTILAYTADAEYYYSATGPFGASYRTAVVTTADGGTYDMGSAASRQLCADRNATHYVNTLVAEAKAHDPDALVTVGMFTNEAVWNAGFNGMWPPPSSSKHRWPVRPFALTRWSNIPFIAVHVYPRPKMNSTGDPPWTIGADVGSMEWDGLDRSKPVLMAEYGAYGDVYRSVTDAALGMWSLIRQSCDYRFSGWIFWTYDSGFTGMYNLLDSGGAINGQLAPSRHPTVCP